jgi:hypothetical protein
MAPFARRVADFRVMRCSPALCAGQPCAAPIDVISNNRLGGSGGPIMVRSAFNDFALAGLPESQ